MTRQKILVPFDSRERDLISVHHALALAERLDAGVLIVHWSGSNDESAASLQWVDDALAEVIADARLAGLAITHMKVSFSSREEFARLVGDEAADLLVLNSNHRQLESILLRHYPRLSGNIIRVKEKEPMELAEEKDGRRWLS